ncbi:MAG: DUF5989 family protein [Myxococcales bacterium]|nr:DUF5989 family protein [Myxococcales bacterium]MDD9968490.1 DUF5989 family protein [Myxococcales bacterium]
MPDPELPEDRSADFARQADQPRPGLAREFLDFLRENKKWWLLPILISVLLLGALVVLSGSVAGPFIYTLF